LTRYFSSVRKEEVSDNLPCIEALKHHPSTCRSYEQTNLLNILVRLIFAPDLSLIMLFCRVSVLEKEDWKHIVDIVTNAKFVVSSIQDVSRKLGDYAKIGKVTAGSGKLIVF
jgi:hypothetical protein